MAEIFFDSPEKAIGKTIRYEDQIDFIIGAVFENVPVHSSLRFDFLLNWESHLTRLPSATPNNLTHPYNCAPDQIRSLSQRRSIVS